MTTFVRHRTLSIAGALGIFAAARAYAPHAHDGPTWCLFRVVTDLPCPGCGMTRAFCALAHGDMFGAMAWNACAIPLALLLAAAAAVALAELARGAPWQFYRRWLFNAKFAYAAAATAVLYHLARCAYWAQDGTLFTRFAAAGVSTILPWGAS